MHVDRGKGGRGREGSRRGNGGRRRKNSKKQYYIEHKQKAAGELGMTLAKKFLFSKHKKVH